MYTFYVMYVFYAVSPVAYQNKNSLRDNAKEKPQASLRNCKSSELRNKKQCLKRDSC